MKAALNSSEELVGDGGFEEEEKQIQIFWRAGNTMVMIMMKMMTTMLTMMTILMLMLMMED